MLSCIPFTLDNFRKRVRIMNWDNGMPYESVPPVQRRTKYVHYPYKRLCIYIIYLHFANCDFRNTWTSKHMYRARNYTIHVWCCNNKPKACDATLQRYTYRDKGRDRKIEREWAWWREENGEREHESKYCDYEGVF